MSRPSKLRNKTIVALIFLAFVTATLQLQYTSVKAQTGQISGAIIPLYTYTTDPTWSTLTNVKDIHPNVPIVAIINPSNGPGNAPDSNFVNGINKLRAHGITVIGYVPIDYGSRSLALAAEDIGKYHSWYDVNGILLDVMSNVPGYEITTNS